MRCLSTARSIEPSRWGGAKEQAGHAFIGCASSCAGKHVMWMSLNPVGSCCVTEITKKAAPGFNKSRQRIRNRASSRKPNTCLRWPCLPAIVLIATWRLRLSVPIPRICIVVKPCANRPCNTRSPVKSLARWPRYGRSQHTHRPTIPYSRCLIGCLLIAGTVLTLQPWRRSCRSWHHCRSPR
ncbi:MAG: hypothetical protein BWY76_02113 [bacterium ADurb.Bin429]|nr:MAG: hypothetical protein BWY76_02113 [bacterium ADurb.Bin429]